MWTKVWFYDSASRDQESCGHPNKANAISDDIHVTCTLVYPRRLVVGKLVARLR
jgi:hypothetical protein